MNNEMQVLFWILVFPGFVFTAVLGLLAAWIVRKVSALVQYRVGPPFLQPFWDVRKLLSKEVLIPQEANKWVFIGAPLVGLAGVLLLSTLLGVAAFWPQKTFVGDVIVAIYLMVLPSLALILGSSASASPHAAVGTAREMKLVMGYELPLVLAFIVVIIKSGGALGLAAIAETTPVASISGAVAFLVSLLCIHAKIGYVPFDMAEAETELGSGVLMEYSGGLLALWNLTSAMMLVALPMFLVVVYLGGFGTTPAGITIGLLKYVGVLVLIILIKNTNPRVRIDQAMRFFWIGCGLVLVTAIALATIGNIYDIGWL
ncbi:MAG: NADH-quinone oxidoreductase subunit H [Sedimentisphaerales bacterium]|nr:NADH-quinone oxidoreductase subunit H [Sedimentisphaerales bacterium]